jgi:hypothetical protein
VALVGLVVVATTTAALWPRTDGNSQTEFQPHPRRITLEEVEAIIGPPNIRASQVGTLGPDEFGEKEGVYSFSGRTNEEDVQEKHWLGSTGELDVSFVHGQAVRKWWRERPGPIGRMTRQWRRWFPE